MKALLGYLNQSEWLYLLNIGNIMQITPLTVHDLYSNTSWEVELTRDSILEKVIELVYYCRLAFWLCLTSVCPLSLDSSIKLRMTRQLTQHKKRRRASFGILKLQKYPAASSQVRVLSSLIFYQAIKSTTPQSSKQLYSNP